MKKNIIFIALISAFSFSGCKDSFFDINENPNLPTESSVQPKDILPMVLKSTATRMGTQYSFAAFWSGYWSRGSGFGPSAQLEDYNITATYQQGQWANSTTSWFDVLMDADIMEKKAKAENDLFYVGISKVIKSIGFMYLVDMYNNVPYSEALNVDKYTAPAYDKGEDIYANLLVQLDSARIIFKNSSLAVSADASKSDVLFGGDVLKWRKLANTQALKLLIHQSEFKTNPAEEIAKIVADGAGFLNSKESANLSITFANNINQVNPVYSTYVRDHNGTLTDGFNRASNYILNKYMDNDDIRYQYIFLEAIAPRDGNLWAGTDFGAANKQGYVSANESIVIGKGLLQSGEDPLWFFTSIESLFLQAEAAQRGWITSSSAESLYKAAVTESFIWLGVEDAENVANTYLTKSVANWASHADKIELIVNQKYLALPGINNFEAWVDYRRLGFPSDVPRSLSAGVGSNQIPLRLQYPQNEYSFNSVNVNAQGTINPQTSKIFWDVK